MNKQSGGKVIGAGGFGCVFKPQLTCKDASGPTHPNGISKLLYFKDAEKEMNEIKEIIPIINSIPNNQLYFLPNKLEQFSMCKISDFTSNDITNIQKCIKILKKGSVESLNTLKQNKNNFRIIQQPYGGEELYKYIGNLDLRILDISFLQNINNKLCDLLENGIKPMNDAGLLHHDIKAPNILYDENKNNLKLIDWGLSKNLNNTNLESIAEECSREPNFNTLSTNILFVNFINDEYIKNKIKLQWKNRFIPLSQVLDINEEQIINFVKIAFDEYKKNKVDYFKNIYAKNCDIFGFLTCYVIIIYKIIKELKNVSEISKISKISEIINKLKNLCIEYMFSPKFASNQINVSTLVCELKTIFDPEDHCNDIDKNLNNLIEEFNEKYDYNIIQKNDQLKEELIINLYNDNFSIDINNKIVNDYKEYINKKLNYKIHEDYLYTILSNKKIIFNSSLDLHKKIQDIINNYSINVNIKLKNLKIILQQRINIYLFKIIIKPDNNDKEIRNFILDNGLKIHDIKNKNNLLDKKDNLIKIFILLQYMYMCYAIKLIPNGIIHNEIIEELENEYYFYDINKIENLTILYESVYKYLQNNKIYIQKNTYITNLLENITNLKKYMIELKIYDKINKHKISYINFNIGPSRPWKRTTGVVNKTYQSKRLSLNGGKNKLKKYKKNKIKTVKRNKIKTKKINNNKKLNKKHTKKYYKNNKL